MGGGSELQRLSATDNLMLGMTAGMMCKSINYPLLNIKNTVQQGLPISANPKVLYRGLPMAMLNLGGTTAFQFWFTGFFQKLLQTSEGHLSSQREIAAAFLGGFVSGIPCSMYELVMIQQQRFAGSIVGTPMRLVKEFGLSVITRGTTMTCGRESFYTMAMLGGTPVIQRTLKDTYNVDPNIAMFAGSLLTAFLSVTMTHPMDIIKTCMQGDCARIKYTNVIGTGKQLVAEGGVKGLFRGVGWRIGLITTTFFLVNTFKSALAPVMFPEPKKVVTE